jgi:hypothetical protein
MMKKMVKLVLCLSLLSMIVAVNAQARIKVVWNQTLPGANCLIHCSTACYCQATAGTSVECGQAAELCCGFNNCGAVANFLYSGSTASTSI